MATSTGVFRYTSLPAEVRNAIMEYALVPGDVYPCSKEPNPTTTNPSRKLLRAVFRRPSASLKIKTRGTDPQTATNQPGFHLLTTCKDAYQDGRHMFYSKNTFHLPPGSARDAENWLNNLTPDHKAMIKSACVTFTLADLAPDVLVEMEKKWLWDLPPATTRQNEQRMVYEVSYILCWRFWQDKIRFLQKWEGLEKVYMKTADGVTWSSDGVGFRALDAKEEKKFLEGAREKVKGELEGMVGEMGWKATKKLLMARGFA